MKGKKTGGRKPGSQNLITTTVKQTVLDAFIELQQDPEANIVTWARENLKEFYLIAAKLIPSEITGPNGQSIQPIYIITQSEADKKVVEAIK